MTPQDAPREDAQTATEATPGTETPAGAEGGREDLRVLRDEIADVVRRWHSARITVCEHTQIISFGEAADEVMAVLEDAALDRMTDRLMEETKLKAVDFRNGVHMDIEPARELAAIWVAAARSMLGDAENYTETKVEFAKVEFDVGLAVDPDNPKPKETYTLVVQRAGKLTPHEARQRAEAERDQLKAAIARVRHLCDLTIAVSCRVEARHQAIDTLAALDQGHDDLPAVREFVADFDPREEPPCPTT